MSLALVAIVLAICAGAVVAVSSRESGVAAIGLAVALVAAALLSEPLPTAPILGVRVVAALLVATIIRSALRGGPRQPSPLGWPAEALLATAGAVAGLGVAVGLAGLAAAAGAPLGVPVPPAAGGPVLPDAVVITGLALTVAAATALLAIGISPLVHGRAGGRRAIGLVLVTQAVLLLRVGIAGPAVELEEIARAALLVVSAATGAALASAAARGRTGPSPDEAAEPDPGGRRPIAAR
jgi:hypothetical protein